MFEYLPYDLDNTFGIDWFGINWAERNVYTWGHPSEPRPLFWRILQNWEYKNWFSSYMNVIVNEVYKESVMFPHIDSLQALLEPSVEDDIYYTLDYGFSMNDFNNGFSEALPYNHTPVGLKPFITARRAATLNQLQVFATPPVFTYVTENVFAGQVTILATIVDDNGVNGVTVLHEWNNDGLMLHADMKDDGQHLDGGADDGRYGVSIPIPDSPSTLEYHIIASDVQFDFGGYPACGKDRVIMTSLPTATLVVNEFMADNESTIADNHDDYEDWVEIYNYGPESVFLGDFYLSDKEDNPTKWQFPDTSIAPGAYLLIWADEETDEGPLHSDIKLSAGGEFVGIFDSDANANVLIDGYAFGAQDPDISFGRLPNGTGPFQSLHPTPGYMNEAITAINHEQLKDEYTFAPNPVSNVMYIRSLRTEGPQTAILFNIYGQVIMESEFQTDITWDISHLHDGIYVLEVIRGREVRMVAKLQKQ